MSQQLISRSPDLKRLQDEGYEVEIRSGYLLLHNVPYVNSRRKVAVGVLASELTLAGDATTCPNTHVALFAGEHPCQKDGVEIPQIKHQPSTQSLGNGLSAQHSFSNKPSCGYKDYYEKMTRYISIISGPAQSLDPNATPTTFKVIESPDEQSVFQYVDTASSRAGISAISTKLRLPKVGIIGLGGTGSYVLDLIAKTPICEIHLFDGDAFLQHNAFRSPGAPSLDDLRLRPKKVHYFAALYSRMHRHIVPHDCYVDGSNLDQLLGLQFAFICMDRGAAKRAIIAALEAGRIPFIDVGMGVEIVEGALLGVLRITTSTLSNRKHVPERISFSDGDDNDEYSQNIQIADLNALNAALAVMKWKKLCGFYQDLEREHHSTYSINVNMLTSDYGSDAA